MEGQLTSCTLTHCSCRCATTCHSHSPAHAVGSELKKCWWQCHSAHPHVILATTQAQPTYRADLHPICICSGAAAPGQRDTSRQLQPHLHIPIGRLQDSTNRRGSNHNGTKHCTCVSRTDVLWNCYSNCNT
jgi:hypothetical protein